MRNYLSRISGPLVDRIDIHIEVPAVPWRELRSERAGLSSEDIRAAVLKARAVQRRRFASGAATNASMTSRQVRQFCKLDAAGELLLQQAMSDMGLSARAHDKILRTARTIADLDELENITSDHIAEAVQYRRLDRNL